MPDKRGTIPLNERQESVRAPLIDYGAGAGQCARCTRYEGDSKCEAFPNGIPPLIRNDSVPHTVEYPGDQGLMFKQFVLPKHPDKANATDTE